MGAAAFIIGAAALGIGTAGVTTGYINNDPRPNQAYLVPYIGWFDVTDDTDQRQSAQFGAEYRFRQIGYGVRPTLGFNVDGKGATYGYGGFNADIPLYRDRVYLIPNFMAGAYSKGSDGKDLGGVIEFRSGLELAYQMQNSHRVGLAFNHISNASIYDSNPGAETVLLTYSIPIGMAAKR